MRCDRCVSARADSVTSTISCPARRPCSVRTRSNSATSASLNWCTESYSEIIDKVRELCGGGVFQMPADISVLENPALRAQFEEYWDTPQLDAVQRMKLFKLAWDMVGSEFAGRHQQYEKFYGGASFLVKQNMYRNYDFDAAKQLVEMTLALPEERFDAE